MSDESKLRLCRAAISLAIRAKESGVLDIPTPPDKDGWQWSHETNDTIIRRNLNVVMAIAGVDAANKMEREVTEEVRQSLRDDDDDYPD